MKRKGHMGYHFFLLQGPKLHRVLAVAIGLLVLQTVNVVRAEVQPARIFQDGMVLQCEKPVAIWGEAPPGQGVKVGFAGQTESAETNENGRWRVTLSPMKASDQPQSLSIEAGKQTKTIDDVLVGEVWLCSGQSNMNYPIFKLLPDQLQIAKGENLPALRLHNVRINALAEPADDIRENSAWEATTPETVGDFSAVAFFFARRLHKELNVPVGILESAWPGSPIRAWMSIEAQQQVPELRSTLGPNRWKDKPPHHAAKIFNGMIHPLAGYTLRGFLWYQGERNAHALEDARVPDQAARIYDTQLETLIRDWRARWHDDEAYFYFVQLPAWHNDRPGWTTMFQSMLNAHRRVENTGMAVTIDTSDPDLLHPKNKRPVGERLARWALHQAYGFSNLNPSGPLVQSAYYESGRVIVKFDYPGEQGIMLKIAPDSAFELVYPGGEVVPAEPQVTDETTIVLQTDRDEKPDSVRYAWRPAPTPVLFNSDLPASPFNIEVRPGD